MDKKEKNPSKSWFLENYSKIDKPLPDLRRIKGNTNKQFQQLKQYRF